MGFYKDCGGLFLFILCQFEFILQFFFLYQMTDTIDNKQNIILTIHKIINYILLFLSVFSHIKTSIIDPGEITINNNREMIEFYYLVHEPLIKRALYITKVKTPEVIKNIILRDKANQDQNKENNKEGEELEEEDDIKSEEDDYNFQPVTSINDTMKKTIEEKYHLKLTRCINCYIIRPINTHHCSICHKCLIEQDHHCPWVNNCIGLFNKKTFILFLFYSFIEVIYSDILFFYYSLYKNINQFNDFPMLLILDVFAIIFGLILGIASTILLYEQYDTVLNDCIQVDYKKGILLEKSTVKQQLQIIFGSIFSYKWFLPFYPGGNNDFFKQMSLYLKLEKSMKKNNKPQNNIKKNCNNKEQKENINDKFKKE